MKDKLTNVAIFSILLFAAFFGYHQVLAGKIEPGPPVYIPYPAPEYREIDKPVCIERPVCLTEGKPVYIDRPVYEVVVIKDTQFEIALEQFQSLAELSQWLAGYDPPELPPGADCDDRAVAMFLAALADGKYMSTEIIESQNHMLCSTIIDNKFYFIDGDKRVFRELNGKYLRLD